MSIAIDFLKSFDPSGWHNLVAIEPETRAIKGATIAPGNWHEAEKFIERYDGRWNLYFSVNEPKPNSRDSKLGKDDIAHLRAIFADADPREGDLDEARGELQATYKKALSLKPGVVIDSGGGYQYFWPLAEKQDAQTLKVAAESQGRGIALLIGGDDTENIDRIMRLPGTWNIPGPDKRAKGRRKALTVLEANNGRRFSMEQLAAAYKPVGKSASGSEDKSEEIRALMTDMDETFMFSASGYNDLPEELRQRFEQLCDNTPYVGRLWRGEQPPKKGTSSSDWRFALTGQLKRDGNFSAEEYGALAWVWDRADPAKIDKRQIARDWINCPVPDLEQLGIVDQGPAPGDLFGDGAKLARTYNFERFDDIAGQIILGAPPLIDGLLDQGAMSVTYGDSNAGKTFVAMDMAYHIATGRPYAGMDVQQGLVVYIAAEGGMGAKKRIMALKQRYPNVSPDFLLLASPVDLRRDDADLVPLTKALRVLNTPIVFLVVDTLSRAMAGGDENGSVDMGAVVKNADLLRSAISPVHINFIHHTGKDKAKGARGHSLLRAATDTEIEVEAIEGAAPAAGTIKVTKQRDMDGNWSQGFKLRVHTLGLSPKGKPITSCTVDLVGFDEARAAGARATAKEREVLSALVGLQDERSGAVAVGAIASRLTDNPSKSDVATTRSHLRNLETKGFVEKVEGGKWAKKVVENASTTLLFDNLSDVKVVESGRRGAAELFD